MVQVRKKISRVQLINFGFKVGLKSLLKKDFKIALKRLILPINYWRVTIFQIVAEYILNAYHDHPNEIKVLDIGSPKLLALFLASRINGTILATDLQDQSLFTEWHKYSQNILKRRNLNFELTDARQLLCPDKFFDVIFSISVLHMIAPADNGDTLALYEIQKKVKPGGLLILEVPYREKYCVNLAEKSNWDEKYIDQPLFQERQYDEAAIIDRIAKNITGELIKKTVLFERIPFERMWNGLPGILTTAFAFIEPWLDVFNISIARKPRQLNKGKSVILFFKISG